MQERIAVVVEGWRFLPHSYSIVNHFQSLELLRRPEVQLFHRDLPLSRDYWKPLAGVFDSESERLIGAIRPPDGGVADVTLRIAYPYDLVPSSSTITAVFGTAEYGCVPPDAVRAGEKLANLDARRDVIVVTPSEWSRRGFVESGAPADRVLVVPHGFEPGIFKPLSGESRRDLRSAGGLEDCFTFLNVGAMTSNKNIGMLLRAFAIVAERCPDVRLRMKGMDTLYRSNMLLSEASKSLTQSQVSLIKPRITYLGGVLSLSAMAQTYQAADAYVSPYSAEGFNLPVLEAAACGLPVICTAGGPTDEFTSSTCALYIASHEERRAFSDGGRGRVLRPSLESLVAHMEDLARCPDAARRLGHAATDFVCAGFTWAHAVDLLLHHLSNAVACMA